MRKHTPEPWAQQPFRIDQPTGRRVIFADGSEPVLYGDVSEANARRIVACVNACAGLSTEALEGGRLTDAIDALERIERGGSPKFCVATAKAALAKLTPTKISTNGRIVDFDAAVQLMDDDLREAVHSEGIEDKQAFFDRYAALHLAKFGEEFVVN